MFSDILIDFNQRPAYVIDKSLDLCLNILNAAMAELADAPDLGSGVTDVGVRVPLAAPSESNPNRWVALFLFLQNLPNCQV